MQGVHIFCMTHYILESVIKHFYHCIYRVFSSLLISRVYSLISIGISKCSTALLINSFSFCASYKIPRFYKYFTGITVSLSFRVIRLSYIQITPPEPLLIFLILSRILKSSISSFLGSAYFFISIG